MTQAQVEFLAFCKYATDPQLRNIYAREVLARRSSYAAIAKSEMQQRGIT